MAVEPRIQTVAGLKQYILRKLGVFGHTIELTDENLDDAINDTIDDWLQYAYSGYIERYFPVQLIEGVQNYILPYDIFAVLQVHSGDEAMIGSGLASNLFSLNQFVASDLYRPGVARIDLQGYVQIQQMIESINLVFRHKRTFDFNAVSRILHLFDTPAKDEKILLHTYMKLNVDTTPLSAGSSIQAEDNIYNERWIKRMAEARAMYQWGVNIGLKYQGSILPNGGQMNGAGILQMADQKIKELDEELQRYEVPTDFMVG